MLRRAFKFSILVGIFIVGSLTAAFAETTSDFTRTFQGINPDGTVVFNWVSHYPKIWNGTAWVNHIVNETPDIIEIRTANISFDFNKNDCGVTLYDPADQSRAVPTYYSRLSIDGQADPSLICNPTPLVFSEDGVSFTAERLDYDVHYDLDSRGFVEWSYTTDPIITLLPKQFEIEEWCEGCPVVTPNLDTTNFGTYQYDSKNATHGALRSLEYSSCVPQPNLECPHTTPRFTAIYSQTLANGESLDIDPTFSYTDADELQLLATGNGPLGGGVACDAGASPTNSTQTGSNMYPWTAFQGTGSNSGCAVVIAQWDLSSIPLLASVSDIKLKIDTGSDSGTGPGLEACDIQEGTRRLNVDTNTNLINDVYNDVGVEYINADSNICETINTTDYIVTLPASAREDLLNNVNGVPAHANMNNIFGVTIQYDDFTRTNNLRHEGYDIDQIELQITYAIFAPPDFTIDQTVTNIGNIHRIDGTITLLDAEPQANVTDIWVRQNGTMINANHTTHNQTSPYSINYGPFWTLIPDDDIRNITTTVRYQQAFINYTDEDKDYLVREYDPDYFPAIVASEGDVNYTKQSDGIHVNRDKGGATFQIECSCLDYADAFTNNTEAGVWRNETVVGAHLYQCPQGTAITACYNDDLLFITSYPANSSTILVSGTAIFDQLGGFLGAPSALLIVLAIYSLGTGRNFPIIAVIAMAAMGIMGVLGLLVLNPAIWGVLIVLTGITIFNQRKFF